MLSKVSQLWSIPPHKSYVPRSCCNHTGFVADNNKKAYVSVYETSDWSCVDKYFRFSCLPPVEFPTERRERQKSDGLIRSVPASTSRQLLRKLAHRVNLPKAKLSLNKILAWAVDVYFSTAPTRSETTFGSASERQKVVEFKLIRSVLDFHEGTAPNNYFTSALAQLGKMVMPT